MHKTIIYFKNRLNITDQEVSKFISEYEKSQGLNVEATLFLNQYLLDEELEIASKKEMTPEEQIIYSTITNK